MGAALANVGCRNAGGFVELAFNGEVELVGHLWAEVQVPCSALVERSCRRAAARAG